MYKTTYTDARCKHYYKNGTILTDVCEDTRDAFTKELDDLFNGSINSCTKELNMPYGTKD